MGFFRKRDSKSSRRHAKFWLMRMRTLGIYAGIGGTVIGLCIYGWLTGSFSRAGDYVHEQIVSATARAGFTVSEILVTGRDNIAQEELLAHLKATEGQPVFSIDLDAAQTALEQISWVERAVVSRRLPDKIVVDIKERKPVALWQYQKRVAVIDKEGKILTSSGLNRWQDLPMIVGEDAPEFAVELLALLRAEPMIAENLASAVRIGNRRWDLHLKNGVLVKLPEENSELALSRLVDSQQKNGIFSRNVVTVDLRIPDRFVVEQKPADQTPDDKNKKNI